MSDLHPSTVLFARGTLARLALWPALRLAVHASWGGPASAEKQRWLAGVLVDQFEPFIVTPSASISASTSSAHPSMAGPPPDSIYVEELLLQIMADEFDVALEDDSAAAVAKDIVQLFGAACARDETFVRELEAQADKIKGRVPTYQRAMGSESESGSEWEDEDSEGEGEGDTESAPCLLDHSEPRAREGPQVDEDGFTIIKKKGHR